jgi:hypothetical protein
MNPAPMPKGKPAVPPVYRPHAGSTVQNRTAGGPPRPTVPPAYTPFAASAQPKAAATPRVPPVYRPLAPAARGTTVQRSTAVIQRRVAPGAKPGTPVVVTNPAYKTKYRAVGRVVRTSRHADHVVVAFDSVATPPSADGFRFHVDDLDHAPVHGDISVVPAGGRTFVLVGTQHANTSPNLSGELHPDLLSGSSLVLEYPSLSGTGRTAFGDEEHSQISDKTQNALARGAAVRGDVTIVGADSRKALIDGTMHRLSLRYKMPDKDYAIATGIVPATGIPGLFLAFAAAAGSGAGAAATVRDLSAIVTYRDGTDLSRVLNAASSRLHAVWSQMPATQVRLIVKHAGNQLVADLRKVLTEFDENKRLYADANYPLDSAIQTRNEGLVTAFYDAVSNLTLLSETLGAGSSKVIVAYGAEHMGPLKALLTDQRR